MKKENAFTLMELMVVIAIGAILATIAVPSFINMMERNRVSAQARDVISAFNLARAEAITRGNTVSVCTSNNGTGCSGSTNWANGWIVFSELSVPPNSAVDGGNCNNVTTDDCIIRVWGATPGVSLSGGADAIVTYMPDSRVAAVISVAVSPVNCAAGANKQKTVSISATGQVTVTEGSCP